MEKIALSEREIHVLEAIVRNYILTASPTGSRFISKQKGFDLSPATIRNVMGDLEEKGFISQPHTSAGRVPTDKGYRHYVDTMIKMALLPKHIKEQIRTDISKVEPSDLHLLMEATSKALSRATDQLGVILSPELRSGIFRHLHIHEIGHQRYLLNLTIDSGFVKSIIVELTTAIEQKSIEAACQTINDRFYGMSLQEIFGREHEVFSDVKTYVLGVIKLFIPSIQKMLEKGSSGEVFTDGQTNILLKPEFFNKQQVSSIIEILEEKSLLMHMFGEEDDTSSRVIVAIGGEIEKGRFSSFSIVKTSYRLGHMKGALGVIGPKRMHYPLLISAVEYTSKVLGELYK
jgi:heat-inducible transcriptional repressor